MCIGGRTLLINGLRMPTMGTGGTTFVWTSVRPAPKRFKQPPPPPPPPEQPHPPSPTKLWHPRPRRLV